MDENQHCFDWHCVGPSVLDFNRAYWKIWIFIYQSLNLRWVMNFKITRQFTLVHYFSSFVLVNHVKIIYIKTHHCLYARIRYFVEDISKFGEEGIYTPFFRFLRCHPKSYFEIDRKLMRSNLRYCFLCDFCLICKVSEITSYQHSRLDHHRDSLLVPPFLAKTVECEVIVEVLEHSFFEFMLNRRINKGAKNFIFPKHFMEILPRIYTLDEAWACKNVTWEALWTRLKEIVHPIVRLRVSVDPHSSLESEESTYLRGLPPAA